MRTTRDSTYNTRLKSCTQLFILLSVIALLISPRAGAQSNNILGYYAYVDSLVYFPPLDKEPYVISSQEIGGNFVTFVGFKGDSIVRIVAVTAKPITDIKKEISLTVDFDGPMPTPGKVTTWGYIFDRNNDGKIDYMALVGGAAAYEGDDFPENFPLRGQPLTREQVDYFVGACKIIFNHITDDNYDGKVDALVQADMDPKRDWVRRELLIRSTRYNDTFDDVRAFRGTPDKSPEYLKPGSKGVPYHPVGKPPAVINKATFDEKTAILNLINTALESCKIGAGQLARRPVR